MQGHPEVVYICPKGKPGPVETIRVSEELHIDLAPDNAVYGIELLSTNRHLIDDDQGELVVVNATSEK